MIKIKVIIKIKILKINLYNIKFL